LPTGNSRTYLETTQSPVSNYPELVVNRTYTENFEISYHNNEINMDLEDKLPSKIQYEKSINENEDKN
jgi:hypothetical protein